MMEGLKFDLNSIGYFFWFVLIGLLAIIFSIIYRPDFIFFGSSLSLYGMIGFFLDLLIDRICGRILKKKLTGECMHEINILGHLLRFVLHVGLIILLILIINKKYCFI